MNASEWCARLEIAIDDDQRRAMRYLERHGLRFLVEFGYQNAVDLARAHWRERRRKKQ